jgi:hypothetical protein
MTMSLALTSPVAGSIVTALPMMALSAAIVMPEQYVFRGVLLPGGTADNRNALLLGLLGEGVRHALAVGLRVVNNEAPLHAQVLGRELRGGRALHVAGGGPYVCPWRTAR